MKKALSILLSIILLISICPLGVFEFTVSAETVSGTCGDNVTWEYDTETATLTISGTGAMSNYSGSSYVTTAPWKSYYNTMKTVVINSGVTQVGDCAFYGCEGLTSITIPDSVTSIGGCAFWDCTGLTSITIPDGVRSIGWYAFSGCSGLKTAGPIGGGYDYEFGWTDKIPYYAFSGCTGLTSVTIPDSVTSIGEQAFYDCTGLTSITIPNSVKSIGNYAFSGCTGLESIIVKSGNAAYHSAGNCLIKTGNKTVIAGCKNSIIPNDGSVTEIGNSAFSGCVGISSITIPDSVTWVRDCAFSGCTGLTSVTIGNGVTEIGSDAFSECTGLTSITIPDSVTSIGWFAFDRCTGLTSITIPDSVTSIDDYAFSDCTGLIDVYYTGTEKQKSEIIIGVENNYLLNATWHYAADSNITYSITYNLGGGTNNKTNPKSYIAGKANISLKNPTKSGYTFKGWYSDKGLTKKVTQISKTPASNITLYAKWEKAYTVTYKLNSGTNSSGNPKTFTATTATITLKNPTRKGYSFKGWYTNSKFTGSKVTKIAKGTKKNITLYAKWSKNTYKITYKLNSGKNNSKNPKTYTVTSAFTLKKPTRKGYTFKGWYSDSKFKKKVTKIAKGSTGNKTLYAKWTKK